MLKNTRKGMEIPRKLLKSRARLTNWTPTLQALEVNGKLKCLSPRDSIILESGDRVAYLKHLLEIKEISC